MDIINTTDIISNSTLELLNSNATLKNVANFFDLSVANVTNQSVVTKLKLFDLYEAYKLREREQLIAYQYVAIIVGTLIILTNLVVVISSGLILKKGQQPKNTYLLLGNVSLADTIIGFSLVFGTVINNTAISNPLCMLQIGLIVCPIIVSIFSVGLIAVDRYIYILHGLYYQRWFSTTRVRIGILITWFIGLTLGFMPATGWTNNELRYTRCSYISLFPGTLIFFNAILSIVPIIIVAILYSIILARALKNVKEITTAKKSVQANDSSNQKPNLRINRGSGKVNYVNHYTRETPVRIIKRSASVNSVLREHRNINNYANVVGNKSKSINDLSTDNKVKKYAYDNIKLTVNNDTSGQKDYESNVSIYTITSHCNVFTSNKRLTQENNRRSGPNKNKQQNKNKNKKRPGVPNKWRAITVVMLTSGSFIVSWMPFFTCVLMYLFCEEKFTNPKCLHYREILLGPLAVLAFSNSVLNPLIYAWWHKGFQRIIKFYIRRKLRDFCCRHNIFKK